MKYILRQRIESAKLELTFSENPIKTIALESGFEGIHPFYHAFKREVGLSPGLYPYNKLFVNKAKKAKPLCCAFKSLMERIEPNKA